MVLTLYIVLIVLVFLLCFNLSILCCTVFAKSSIYSIYIYMLAQHFAGKNQLNFHKVTIRPRFSGKVRIFNDVSRKKIQFSRDAHLSRFWLGVLDLSQFARLCSRMLTLWWPKIISDFICLYEKIAGVGALPWTPLGELRTLPQTAKSDPQRSHPSIHIPDCGAQIMVTLNLDQGVFNKHLTWLRLCTVRYDCK